MYLHLNKLSSGKAIVWLFHLSREASKKEDHHQRAPRRWDTLRKKRGSLISSAAKKGCKAAWRQFVPLLPHEKPNPTWTDYSVTVGLSGLQACLLDGELDFTTISEHEARLAVRYAVNELNGFAPWLPELAKHRQETVQDILSECIRGEWQLDASHERANEVLHDLLWSGEGLVHLVEEPLLSQLLEGDPKNTSVLENAVVLLLRRPTPPMQTLVQVAESRVRDYPIDSRGFLVWLAVWLQIDAIPAIKFLEEILSSSQDPIRIMERICAILGSNRSGTAPIVREPDFLLPDRLRTFIRLVFQYIRPNDDIQRSGPGAYSPTDRDDAQRFRDELLDRLAQSASPEAGLLLRELLDDPNLVRWRDWIKHLIDKHIERLADLPPWKPIDIRNFSEEYEIDPRTDHDLFKIACRRLMDLKYDVEKAENSLRNELHPNDDESILRSWIARKLVERSRERYTVPQEEEIDQRWRPDLRIENPKTAPISIEIKWASELSLKALLERLENQLIGQYLRDHHSRYGIYLLGYIKKRSYWKNPANGQHMSLREVQTVVEAHAKALSAERNDVEKIEVIWIDFTGSLYVDGGQVCC